MKALTVKQPWVWAIMHGGKNVENRNWAPRDRPGRIAIHAGLTQDDNLAAWNFIGRQKPVEFVEKLPYLHRGAIVGTVDLIDCHMPNPLLQHPPCQHYGCEPWGQDVLSHWVLSNPTPLAEPIPCRGALGLWNLPDDIAASLA